VAAFADWLDAEVLADVPHRHNVSSVSFGEGIAGVSSRQAAVFPVAPGRPWGEVCPFMPEYRLSITEWAPSSTMESQK
jgi:hypothetical protein